MRFFEREQFARVVDDVCVGHAEIRGRHARIGFRRIAEPAEQSSARFPFQLEPRRANPAIAISRPAVLKREGVHHAISGEPVVMASRGELGIGAIAIERAVQPLRDFARYRKIARVAFDKNRREDALQHWLILGERTGHRGLLRRRRLALWVAV